MAADDAMHGPQHPNDHAVQHCNTCTSLGAAGGGHPVARPSFRCANSAPAPPQGSSTHWVAHSGGPDRIWAAGTERGEQL